MPSGNAACRCSRRNRTPTADIRAAHGEVAEPLVSATDVKVIAGLPPLALLSRLLPFRFWPVLSRRFAGEALEAVPDRHPDNDRDRVDLRRAVAARDIEDTMLLLRASARREEAVQRMAEAFAGRLESCVQTYPDQWHGWYYR